MMEIQWDIRRAGRAWRGDEAHEPPEKLELEAPRVMASLAEVTGVSRLGPVALPDAHSH
jgi:hypothetical protein